MPVKEARAKAREFWENPGKFVAGAETGSFKEIAAMWLKRHVEANELRSRYEIERHLSKYVYPKWKDRKFLEVRRREVNELLDQIADNHGASQADAVLATIRGIMSWYQSRDEHYASPIVKGMRRGKQASRSRILNDEEIRSIWKVADESGTFGGLVQMLLLTAQRKDKVATIRWDDIADSDWAIRTNPREKGTAGRLELPDLARQIIAQQPRIIGNPFVFAGRGAAAFNSFSQRKRELEQELSGIPHWTLHDLRRTARSLMSRAGVRPDIAERVLGHAIGGVEGIYDRHHYFAEKADALRVLARLVEDIVNHAQLRRAS
jgi:integrase